MKDHIKRELKTLLKGLVILFVSIPGIVVAVVVVAKFLEVGILVGLAMLLLSIAYCIGKLLNIHFEVHE